ncbi:MAG: YggT family protein [Brevinematia bacterium]
MIYNIFLFLIFVVKAYEYIFIVYILLSFFPVNRNNFIIRMIDNLCEPFYNFILRFLPHLKIGMFDFSPIYVFIILWLLRFGLSKIAVLFL